MLIKSNIDLTVTCSLKAPTSFEASGNSPLPPPPLRLSLANRLINYVLLKLNHRS